MAGPNLHVSIEKPSHGSMMKKISMKETEDGKEKIDAIECMNMIENTTWMKIHLAEKPNGSGEQPETMGRMKMAQKMQWMKMMLVESRKMESTRQRP